jgi:hypothetical protein
MPQLFVDSIPRGKPFQVESVRRGNTPTDFIASMAKTDGGYGPYGNDISTWYHDAHAGSALAILGIVPPPEFISKLQAHLSASPHQRFSVPLSEYRDPILSALVDLGQSPSSGLSIDLSTNLWDIYHTWHAKKICGEGELIFTSGELIPILISGAGGNGNQNPDGGFERDPVGTTLHNKVAYGSGVGFFPQRSCVWRTAAALRILDDHNPDTFGINNAISYLLQDIINDPMPVGKTFTEYKA